MTIPVPKPCRHRNVWVYASAGANGRLLWCYQCGAIRCVPGDKRWTKPTGPDGPNPAMKRK